MPTAIGAETIGERLQRFRTEQTRVRATIARHENNGAQHNIGGAAFVTEIAYDRALKRDDALSSQIAALEARLTGSSARLGIAVTQTISRT